MYTLDEMNTRLDYLTSISPSGGKKLIEELREAIQAYLARDSDFELQVNKTLDKVIADTFHNSRRYERQELIDVWKVERGEPPLGYDNVEKLFKGAEIFEEIMTVTDREFRAAFYTERKTSTSGDITTLEYHNRLTEKWVAELGKAKGAELQGLKTIMQYCANRSYSLEWAILFENHGKNINLQPVRSHAKEIFVVKGYGWLIETFNLNVYRPSYMADLLDWTDEENNSQNKNLLLKNRV